MNIAIIPARSGSKRIKNKNIKLFNGKPIIAWTIKTAIKSKLFDKVIVSTDSKKIAKIAEYFGAEIPFLRSKKISDDKTNVGDVVRDTLYFFKKKNININHACLLYATAPFIDSRDLKKGFKKIKNSKKLDFVLSITKFNTSYHRALRVVKNKIIPNVKTNVLKRSQDLEDLYYDSAQFTFGKSKSWIESKHAFLAKSSFVEIPYYRTQDIDTIDDWKRAEIIFKLIKKI